MSKKTSTDGLTPGQYPYEPWEHGTRNEPNYAKIEEPFTISELTSPSRALDRVLPEDSDLTTNAGTGQEAIGQRIVVTGRVLDEKGVPVPDVLIEIWQANAAGRYTHEFDEWKGPIDPNFIGRGRCKSDAQGVYRFLTVKPGGYPWKDETNEWRPAHIHLSVMGPTIVSRLVTQLYFEGDPLFDLDMVFQALTQDEQKRVVCHYDHKFTEPGWAMGYYFDIVLRGPQGTPWETDHDHEGGHR